VGVVIDAAFRGSVLLAEGAPFGEAVTTSLRRRSDELDLADGQAIRRFVLAITSFGSNLWHSLPVNAMGASHADRTDRTWFLGFFLDRICGHFFGGGTQYVHAQWQESEPLTPSSGRTRTLQARIKARLHENAGSWRAPQNEDGRRHSPAQRSR